MWRARHSVRKSGFVPEDKWKLARHTVSFWRLSRLSPKPTGDGIAEFSEAETGKKAEPGAKYFFVSEPQFQQADFEGEGLLHIAVEQALGLFQHGQIFLRLPDGNSFGDLVGSGDLRQV